MDLNGFKNVNDVYGHSVGDKLLREIGNRLQLVTEDAFLARLGGDEFTAVIAAGHSACKWIGGAVGSRHASDLYGGGPSVERRLEHRDGALASGRSRRRDPV